MFNNKGGRHFWFAKNLINLGYNPTIFCANTFHQKKGEVDLEHKIFKVFYSDSIPFVFIKTFMSFSNGLDRIKNMVMFYLNLIKTSKSFIKKGDKPDLILASSVHPLTLVAGIKIAKILNIPVVCEVRDLWPEAIFKYKMVKENSIFGRILVSLEYWIYRNSSSIIFTKEGDVDYIKEKKWDIQQGGTINLRNVFYINNGVDIESFNLSVSNNTFNDSDLDSSKFNVVYTGAIAPINNLNNLISVAANLIEYTDIQFLIYGDGIEREHLEKKVKSLNISNIKFKGYINKKFIPYILSKSSLNILNYSATEYNWSRGNSSNKLFEYLASGKPVLSTIKMGYSIINKYKCGLEIDNNNPNEIIDAILKFRNMDSNLYNLYSINAKNAAKDFDFKILTKKLVNIFELQRIK